MAKNNDNNSHRLLYSEIKERLKDQFDSIDSLDTKAGVTLGFVGAILAGLINSDWFLQLPNYLLMLVLLPLVLAAASLLRAIFVRTYSKDPEPKELISGYEKKSEEETLRQLIRNFEACFGKNEPAIDDKKKYLNWGLILLAVAILILSLLIISTAQSSQWSYGKYQIKEWGVKHHGRYR